MEQQIHQCMADGISKAALINSGLKNTLQDHDGDGLYYYIISYLIISDTSSLFMEAIME